MKEINTQDIYTLINTIHGGGYQLATSEDVKEILNQKCLTTGLLFEINSDGKCVRIYAKEPGKYLKDCLMDFAQPGNVDAPITIDKKDISNIKIKASDRDQSVLDKLKQDRETYTETVATAFSSDDRVQEQVKNIIVGLANKIYRASRGKLEYKSPDVLSIINSEKDLAEYVYILHELSTECYTLYNNIKSKS